MLGKVVICVKNSSLCQLFDFKLDNQLDLICLNGKLTLVSYVYPWVILLSLVIPFQLKLVY